MAGAFGFESGDHYQVSMACGERALLPTVRAADDATLIVADGFSCREQIAQGTDRTALHLANVLALAFAGETGSRAKERPETALLRRRRAAERRANLRAAAVMVGAVGAIGAGALWWRSR
jgi:hypothetical protein